MIYIGYRQGVFMQGIVAVSYSLSNALEFTKEVMNREKDNYHMFYVAEFENGVPIINESKQSKDLYKLIWGDDGYERYIVITKIEED